MNILLVLPFRTNGTGGVGRVVRSLQLSLADRGFNAYILMAGYRCTIERVNRVDWSDTYEIRYRPMSIASAKTFLAFWFYLPIILYHLARFLRVNRIDVVHIHFPAAVLVYFAILRPFSGWKLVSTLHGTDINSFGDQKRIARLLVKV